MVRNVVDTCLRKILVDRSVAGAVDYAKQTISDLLQNKLDISLLVITKVHVCVDATTSLTRHRYIAAV